MSSVEVLEATGFRVRTATPILTHLRYVIVQPGRTFWNVNRTGLLVPLLPIHVVSPPIQTAGSGLLPFGRLAPVDRRLRLRNLLLHLRALLANPLEVAVATGRAIF